jgi:hypothetical protein
MIEKLADLGPRSLDGFLDAGDLVRAEIVHDDAIAGRQGGNEELLDTCEKDGAVDWTVENQGRVDAIIVVDGFDHICCWTAIWPAILARLDSDGNDADFPPFPEPSAPGN